MSTTGGLSRNKVSPAHELSVRHEGWIPSSDLQAHWEQRCLMCRYQQPLPSADVKSLAALETLTKELLTKTGAEMFGSSRCTGWLVVWCRLNPTCRQPAGPTWGPDTDVFPALDKEWHRVWEPWPSVGSDQDLTYWCPFGQLMVSHPILSRRRRACGHSSGPSSPPPSLSAQRRPFKV